MAAGSRSRTAKPSSEHTGGYAPPVLASGPWDAAARDAFGRTVIEQIARQRQAGHYDQYTNIGAGMRVARSELDRNGRPSALKLILLMTDGIATVLESVDPVSGPKPEPVYGAWMNFRTVFDVDVLVGTHPERAQPMIVTHAE